MLYKRVIQPTANPRFIIIINLAIASIFAYFVIFSLLAVFQCIPVESFWQQFSPEYNTDFYCLPESNAPVANAVFSIITDFVVALLPITLFTQIKLPRAQIISLGIVFGVGFMYVLTDLFLNHNTNNPPHLQTVHFRDCESRVFASHLLWILRLKLYVQLRSFERTSTSPNSCPRTGLQHSAWYFTSLSFK